MDDIINTSTLQTCSYAIQNYPSAVELENLKNEVESLSRASVNLDDFYYLQDTVENLKEIIVKLQDKVDILEKKLMIEKLKNLNKENKNEQ